MARLQFKFHAASSPHAREALVSALGEAGASKVRPLFPGEKDPELSLVYVVEAGDGPTESRLLSMLGGSPDVEYAEREPRRRLIR